MQSKDTEIKPWVQDRVYILYYEKLLILLPLQSFEKYEKELKFNNGFQTFIFINLSHICKVSYNKVILPHIVVLKTS